MEKDEIILASASPRRSEILTQIGIPFRVEVSDIEEAPKSLNPFEFPIENAQTKALAVSEKNVHAIVLGFDTLVFFEGEPLGKPQNEIHALEMLQKLNGKTHQVITGVAIAKAGRLLAQNSALTEVNFRDNTLQELKDYVNSKDPLDKAGAYGIQTQGARLIQSIKGCYYNVVGLPVALTLDMLRELKVKV